jgi:hypothetical protein
MAAAKSAPSLTDITGKSEKKNRNSSVREDCHQMPRDSLRFRASCIAHLKTKEKLRMNHESIIPFRKPQEIGGTL